MKVLSIAAALFLWVPGSRDCGRWFLMACTVESGLEPRGGFLYIHAPGMRIGEC